MTKDKFKAALKSFGLPRLIIAGFLLLLLIAARELSRVLLGTCALDLQFVNIFLGDLTDRLFISPFDQSAQIVLEELVLDLHGRESYIPLQ